MFEEEEPTVRTAVAGAMFQARQRLDQYILRCAYAKELFAGRPISKQVFPDGGFTWDIYGDLRNQDSSEIINAIKQDVLRLGSPKLPQRSAEPERIAAFGTFFYPKIWVGELPERTPDEILHGNRPAELVNTLKALDTEYKGHKVVVNRDGYVGIAASSRTEATTLLNEIMATAWLFEVDATTVREAEVGNARIDADRLTVNSQGMELVSLRTVPSFGLSWAFGPFDIRFRPRVADSELLNLISRAEILNSDPFSQNVLSFLFEAHTHLSAEEYRQGLAMAWLVIESWINKTWTETVEAQDMSRHRRERLADGNTFTAEIKAETLNLMGKIDPGELSKLSLFRRRRNRVVHEGYSPTQREAQEAMEFARDIVRSRLVERLEGRKRQ